MPTPSSPAATHVPSAPDVIAEEPPAPAVASDEDGSLVSEYGLVAVLGATVAGLAISWAKGGAIASLLGAVLKQVRLVIGS